MSLLAVVLFFVYAWGLGFSVTRLVKESESFLERNVMRVGLGLSALVVLGIALNALRIPLDYRIFLFLSVAGPAYWLFFRKGHKNLPGFSLRLTVSNLAAFAVIVIFLATFFMYSSGAFRYPYLEDDDPWGHASAAKYVAVEKTVFDSPFHNFQYMDPYPPGYDLLLGIMVQSSGDVMWAVKFFNALIISLSVLFFYFFAREFTGSRGKALFATFVLASVPAYLSHFIWAPALAMAVFFQAMYALEMVKHDRKWWMVSGVGLAAILLAHPIHAVKLWAFVLIYLGVRFFSARLAASLDYFKAVALGVGLSLFWWAFKLKSFSGELPSGFRGGEVAAAEAIRQSPNVVSKVWTLVTRVLNAEGGTATRVYELKDFVVVHSANMINNPVGFGLVASLLVFAGVVAAVLRFYSVLQKKVVVAVFGISFLVTFVFLRLGAMQLVLAVLLAVFILALLAVARGEKLLWLPVTVAWLLFAFLGVNSLTFNLPVGLFAFRFWMILAVPVAILAAEGFFALLGGLSLLKLDKASAMAAKVAIIILVVAGVFLTSSRQKFDTNTSCWPAGAFWSGEFVLEPGSGCPVPGEVVAYNWLRTLEPGTRVFTFSNPDQVIAYGAYSCGWCEAEAGVRKSFANISAAGLHDFLKSSGYGYIVIGGIEARGFGINETIRLVNDLASSQDLFSIAYNGGSAIFFRVN